LYDEAPPDTDNIVKPIQDALIGLVLSDDSLVTDVESHRRNLTTVFDLARLPSLLVQGIAQQMECVYVRVADAQPIEDLL
jgi:hypothetical protein